MDGPRGAKEGASGASSPDISFFSPVSLSSTDAIQPGSLSPVPSPAMSELWDGLSGFVRGRGRTFEVCR